MVFLAKISPVCPVNGVCVCVVATKWLELQRGRKVCIQNGNEHELRRKKESVTGNVPLRLSHRKNTHFH